MLNPARMPDNKFIILTYKNKHKREDTNEYWVGGCSPGTVNIQDTPKEAQEALDMMKNVDGGERDH
jgi:hypothetical protein